MSSKFRRRTSTTGRHTERTRSTGSNVRRESKADKTSKVTSTSDTNVPHSGKHYRDESLKAFINSDGRAGKQYNNKYTMPELLQYTSKQHAKQLYRQQFDPPPYLSAEQQMHLDPNFSTEDLRCMNTAYDLGYFPSDPILQRLWPPNDRPPKPPPTSTVVITNYEDTETVTYEGKQYNVSHRDSSPRYNGFTSLDDVTIEILDGQLVDRADLDPTPEYYMCIELFLELGAGKYTSVKDQRGPHVHEAQINEIDQHFDYVDEFLEPPTQLHYVVVQQETPVLHFCLFTRPRVRQAKISKKEDMPPSVLLLSLSSYHLLHYFLRLTFARNRNWYCANEPSSGMLDTCCPKETNLLCVR